jgi:hypothetical protein
MSPCSKCIALLSPPSIAQSAVSAKLCQIRPLLRPAYHGRPSIASLAEMVGNSAMSCQEMRGTMDSQMTTSGQSTHYERTPAFGAEAGCGAGALPPHPQDFALWCLSRCGLCAGRQMKGGWRSIPLDRSRPLSRRSGCFPAFPYPPLSPG